MFKRFLAERKGFEPSMQLPTYKLSRLAPSTTRTPLCLNVQKYTKISLYKIIKHINLHISCFRESEMQIYSTENSIVSINEVTGALKVSFTFVCFSEWLIFNVPSVIL